jgi:hypothetical protein
MEELTKKCTKCGKIKLISEFSLDNASSDRHTSRCKECLNKDSRERYSKNIEKERERSRIKNNIPENRDRRKEYGHEWYISNKEKKDKQNNEWRRNHRDKTREYVRKSHAKHKEKTRVYNKEYREKNGEYCRELSRVWSLNNKEKNNARQRKKEAKKVSAPGRGTTAEQSFSIKQESGFRCVYCGKKFNNLQIDHVEPLSLGGANDVDNAVPACASCNFSKHNKPLLMWLYQRRSK